MGPDAGHGKRFRGGARKTEPVLLVEDELITRTLPLLTPTVRDMVLLQRLTSMRPGELVAMTAAGPDGQGLAVGDLADLYVVQHVLTYYRGPDGRETGEVRNIAGAMRMLKAVWGSTPAAVSLCWWPATWCTTMCSASPGPGGPRALTGT